MKHNLFCLFCLFSFTSIHAFECDDYELTEFEEENINDFEEEIENNNYLLAKSAFKHTYQKDLPDSNNAMATLEAGPSAVVAGCVNAITGAIGGVRFTQKKEMIGLLEP